MSSRVVLVDAVRSPFGKAGSLYQGTRADDIMVRVLRGLLERNPKLDPKSIDDVAIAAATQVGDQLNNLERYLEFQLIAQRFDQYSYLDRQFVLQQQSQHHRYRLDLAAGYVQADRELRELLDRQLEFRCRGNRLYQMGYGLHQLKLRTCQKATRQ